MNTFRVVFINKFNQRVSGGSYSNFSAARVMAKAVSFNGAKSSWQIIRISDDVVLAQSK